MIETELQVREYLTELSRRGVALWLDQGVLRYKCQRGSLQRSDLEQLRINKGLIIESMSRNQNMERQSLKILPRLPSESVPLSSIQRGMWNAFEKLKITKSKRSMATAVRLTGPLNVELVRKSISHVVQRHEALRTRIVVVNAVPFQEVHQSREVELPVVDLTDIPTNEVEQAARRAVDEFIDTPISLTDDELFVCRLFKLGASDHVLVTALDHVIVDNLSIHILWHEIDTVYTDLFLGRPISLPPVAIQFPDYVVWEQRHQWTAQKASFWESRTRSAGRVRLPCGVPSPRSEKLKITEIPIRFGPTLSATLRETSRQCDTTVVMAVLTAYLATTLIWSGESTITSGFIITGRDIPGLDGTIGWFGSGLFLCVRLRTEGSFRSLLGHVTREYYLALEYADHGRVCLERPLCLWNTWFNWRVGLDAAAPPARARPRPEQPADGVVATPFEFTLPILDIDWSDDPDLTDGEPSITFTDEPSGITGTFVYRPDLFSADIMERFCNDFVRLTTALSQDPDCLVSAVSLSAHTYRKTG